MLQTMTLITKAVLCFVNVVYWYRYSYARPQFALLRTEGYLGNFLHDLATSSARSASKGINLFRRHVNTDQPPY